MTLDSGFTRYDTGKLRWALLPRQVMRDIVKVLEFGAKKYKRDNWKKIKSLEDLERCWDSFDRHRDAYQLDGEVFDKETGLPHTSHMLCNLVFIHYLTQYGEE